MPIVGKSRSFFFTNDFVLNYLNFLKTAQILAEHRDGAASFYYNSTKLKNQLLFNKFAEPFKNNDIVDFADTMKNIYNSIVGNYERLLQDNQVNQKKNQNNRISLRLNCPKSKCFEVKHTYLEREDTYETKIRVLKVLTIFFASASSLLIIVYLFLYLLIDSQLVRTYKKL